MQLLKTADRHFRIDVVDGVERTTPITATTYNRLLEAKATKKVITRGVTNGVAIAGGLAAGEALLSGAAVATETAVVAVEGLTLLPILATGALIAGVCVGTYAIYKAVTD